MVYVLREDRDNKAGKFMDSTGEGRKRWRLKEVVQEAGLRGTETL